MKLLFVENRYLTWVFASAARRLAAAGHEIHWLVQNPMFAPAFGRVHRIPFPRPAARAAAAGADYAWLRRTDRGVLHFGVDDAHYPHYDRHVARILDIVKPDVVFGEATEFHELLVIRRCRERGVAFLSPSVTRYPADRLAFLDGDTMDPVGGDGSELSDVEADAMVDTIATRRVVPSYMRPATQVPRTLPLTKLADKLRITAGWARGEHFITPSPRRKLQLEAERRAARERWEALAAARPGAFEALRASGRPWVLYALQMQPESNIDVWGSPWNDQSELVRRAARALAAQGATLVVKPNPKSKYELHGPINDAIEAEPNIVRLAHATPMGDVFPAASMVFTVTGTVLLESVFSRKPVASLGTHAMTRYPGVRAIATPEDVAPALGDALAGCAPLATRLQARELLQALHRASYGATMWDPVAQPQQATAENIERLGDAFVQVLARRIATPTAPAAAGIAS